MKIKTLPRMRGELNQERIIDSNVPIFENRKKMKITPPYCTLCVQVFITESESESEQQKVIALLYSSNKSRHEPNSNGIELVYTFKNVCFFGREK